MENEELVIGVWNGGKPLTTKEQAEWDAIPKLDEKTMDEWLKAASARKMLVESPHYIGEINTSEVGV
jgi:hypothetical protein